MQVLATQFKPGTTITLVSNGAGGWRFSHWSKHASATNTRPSREDCERVFADPQSAVSYFGTRYA